MDNQEKAASPALGRVEPGHSPRVVLHRRTRLPGGSPLVRSRQLRASVVLGRRAKRRGRCEAISVDFDDFDAAFTRCGSHVMRSDRVSVILLESQSCCTTRNSRNSQARNSQNSLARSLHVVHDARCVQNSLWVGHRWRKQMSREYGCSRVP